jgi:hypothetical protein
VAKITRKPLWLIFRAIQKQNRQVIDMLKADLEATGIPYVDESGRYADFSGTPQGRYWRRLTFTLRRRKA